MSKSCDTSDTKMHGRAYTATCFGVLPQDRNVVTDNEVKTSIFMILDHLKESEIEGKKTVVKTLANVKGDGGGGSTNSVKQSLLESFSAFSRKCD